MFPTKQLLASLGLTAAASFTLSASAADIAVFDADLFSSIGFTFDDFSEPGAVGVSGGLLNIDIATDGNGTAGLFGGVGADFFADFDPVGKFLEVTLSVDPLNVASDFRVVLADTDGGGAGDEFQFFVDISGTTAGQTVTLSQELLNPGPVFVQPGFGQFPGDEIQNYGLTQIQIQSAFGGTDRLKIDVESVKIVDPDNPLIAALNTETFASASQPFTFGTFSETGVLDATGDNFVINADPTTPAGAGGGVGFNGLDIDFEATEALLQVEAKLLPGNTAEDFVVLLGDNDGDDSGPGLGSEDYVFGIGTNNFNADEFTTLSIPLGSGSESEFVTTFGFTNGGDGLQNFDLSQMQIQAGDDVGVLNIEIANVSIIEAAIAGLLGDFDNSGAVEQGDLNLVLTNWGSDRTFEDPGGTAFDTLTVDQEELNLVLTNWGSSAAPSFEGSTVPEPALIGVVAAAGLLLRRRRSA
ncbi:MAG: hypothetical protein AAGJ38_01945 [Planctomycetota bacterium]